MRMVARTGRRVLSVVGVLVGVAGLGSAAAAASPTGPAVKPATITCTDSWAAATSGAWSTTSNWSTGNVPTSTDNTCITKAGTYAVTLTSTESSGTLTLGGSSGTQTLTVKGNASADGNLNLSTLTGSEIRKHGVLALDSLAVAGADSAEVSNDGTAGVTLTNNGTFETLDATTNDDIISLDLVNTSHGKVSIGGANTMGSPYANITNNGKFTVTSTGDLAIIGGSQATTTFTQSGGTLVDNGSFSENSAIFTQSGGVESGNTVSLTDFSVLNDSVGGGSFSFENTDTLSGTIPADQTITVLGTPTATSAAELLGNVTNDGTFLLDAEPVAGAGAVSLANDGTSGTTLINNGTFKTLGATHSSVNIYADLTNDPGGIVEIAGASTMVFSAANITNNGTFTITSTSDLAITGGSQATTTFTQSGGTLAVNGTFLLNGAVFAQSGGVVTGHTVMLTDSSTLDDSAGGNSFDLFNEDSLSGTIPAGQTVTVIGNSTYGRGTADLAADVINDGTFILDSKAAGDEAYLYGAGDPVPTFTNNGTVEANGVRAGSDYLAAPFTNNGGGIVDIAISTQNQAYQTMTNSGLFNIFNTGSLLFQSGSEAETNFYNDGTLDNKGTLQLSGSIFTNSGIYEVTYGVNSLDASTLIGTMGNAGTVNLGGTLDIATVGSPPVGTTFDVIGNGGWVNVNGTFSSLDFDTDTYTVSYEPDSVTVTVATSTAGRQHRGG